MPSPTLTLAIPSWDNYNQLIAAIVSLVRNTDFDDEIVVINNGCGVDLQDLFNRFIPYNKIRILTPGRNLGWMGGINLALKESDSDLFCMCNDDVLFTLNRHFWHITKSWFSAQDEANQVKLNVGGIGPTSNYVAGYQNIRQYELPDLFLSSLLIGFCATYRREVLFDGLDESLPGGDDFDLSIRVRGMGFQLLVHRGLFVYHYGSQTGRRIRSDWDSTNHQLETVNALVRKHGLRKWYDCMQGQIREVGGAHQIGQRPNLADMYHEAKSIPSDMWEHMETLKTFAATCDHVTEFGTNDGTSTLAFLMGKPSKVETYDIKRWPQVTDLEKAASDAGVGFQFHEQSVLEADISPTDMLFVDDLHTYAQVRDELARHHSKVRKYILFHDTDTLAYHGENGDGTGIKPAIMEFLRVHPEWRITTILAHNNGLMALTRLGQ